MSDVEANHIASDGESKSNKTKKWVKFEEEPEIQTSVQQNATGGPGPSSSSAVVESSPAVLNTESVQINLDRVDKVPDPATFKKNVEFVNVRQGFANGDVLVTLLPVNTRWPWITSARFRPELVPEELMAQGLTLTVEEYVQAMELLVNDGRFTLYNICYKRVLVCWITLAFVVLLALLFSGLTGLTLFSLGVFWLILNAAAIFLCMWVKMKLSKGLEQCLAGVNKLLNKHKLILALDDRGRISCHKVHLCFIYFDSEPCVQHIQQFIDSEEGKTIMQGWEQRLDVSTNDIVIQGTQSTRLSRKQERGVLLYLRYAARWGARMLQNRIKTSGTVPGRHAAKHLCPCQFIENHLLEKPPAGIAKFFKLPYEITLFY